MHLHFLLWKRPMYLYAVIHAVCFCLRRFTDHRSFPGWVDLLGPPPTQIFPIIQITYSHTHFLMISLLPTLPTQTPHFTMRPPLSHFHCFKEGQDHCEECGRCDYLKCIDHFGCTCERGEEEDEYNGSLCASEVRYAITQLDV